MPNATSYESGYMITILTIFELILGYSENFRTGIASSMYAIRRLIRAEVYCFRR